MFVVKIIFVVLNFSFIEKCKFIDCGLIGVLFNI